MGRASFQIAYTYAGPVRQLFDADNESGPTSWIGYGWHFSTPFVSVQHKGTVSKDDDVYYCNLGQYGGGQLLQAANLTFFVSTNPAIRVQPTFDVDSLISAWEFKFPDGIRMRFGTTISGDKAERVIRRFGGSIVASPYAISGGSTFIYRWDLAVMDSRPLGATMLDRLEFRYERIDGIMRAGEAYSLESYIKNIVAVNAAGKEVERYQFNLTNKAATEFTPVTSEKRLSQTLIESKALTNVEWFVEGTTTVQRRFINFFTILTPSSYKKRFLDSIFIETRTSAGTYITDPAANWKFTYDASPNKHYALAAIVRGAVKEEFLYGRPDFSKSEWKDRTQQDTIRRMKKSTGTEVGTSVPADLKSKWENKTLCSERFCFVTTVERNPNRYVPGRHET